MKKFVKLSEVSKSQALNNEEMKDTKGGAKIALMYGIPIELYGVPIIMYGVPISLYAVHDIDFLKETK